MRIMAHTIGGQRDEIKVSSCPILITSNILSLLDRDDSPLYLADTVVLQDEIRNITEGDKVSDKQSGRTGVVYYSKGWRIHWSDDSYSKFVVSEHIDMVVRSSGVADAQAVKGIEGREEVKLVVDDEEFFFTSMMVKIDNRICISGRPQLVNENDIFISTGIIGYDSPLYFGQFYKGGIVGLDDEMRIVSVCKNKIIYLED